MEKHFLTGNEAVARGIYEAGAVFASAYPGTPSSEILKEVVQYLSYQKMTKLKGSNYQCFLLC